MCRKTVFWMLLASLLTAGGMSLLAQPNGPADNTEFVWHSRDDEHLVDLFTVGGRPVNRDPTRRVKVLINTGYAVGYSEERRNPLWAAYRASGVSGKGAPTRFERSDFFSRDIRVLPAIDGRTFGNDFDRGHMVPNAAIASQYGALAQMETFFMTNICPQKAPLNQGPWKELEHFIPQIAEDKKHVFVIAGPIFGANPAKVKNGADRDVQIPDAFYMILIDTDKEFRDRPELKILAYKFEQATGKEEDYKDRKKFGTSVKAIEDATQLTFFPEFMKLIKNWDKRIAEVEMTHWELKKKPMDP
jgi:endonuclease G